MKVLLLITLINEAFFRKNTQTIFQQAITATNVSATIANVIQQKFGLAKVHCVHNVVDVDLFHFKKMNKKMYFVGCMYQPLVSKKILRVC
jgi:hypothetical protein